MVRGWVSDWLSSCVCEGHRCGWRQEPGLICDHAMVQHGIKSTHRSKQSKRVNESVHVSVHVRADTGMAACQKPGLLLCAAAVAYPH
jgi:hypothetical protein